ncbi:aminoglycoside phosphotransferase family protein [Streptomyces sp. NPDC047097]|uniref:aminoglycoside phosphotransferase family protein n=1 Tax=Streptomyces sp. NPDC047097 TaxID=3155260 RepID=UPI0033F96631
MVEIPEGLARAQLRWGGERGRAFLAALPERAERFLTGWGLRRTGPAMHGVGSLVLPVEAVADGTRAALKLTSLDEESAGEADALRAWRGEGAVRLLRDDPGTGTLLLERLDEHRPLSAVPDSRSAVRVPAGLAARLSAVRAPDGLRRLDAIARRLLDRAPAALTVLGRPEDRRLVRGCAAALAEVAGEPGDRLLHWDLHYGNVLAADREPWLAIDPKPLAGDPGFELLPALWNRFEPGEVRWRFDLLTEALDLDRERARAWTLARVLQDALWRVEMQVGESGEAVLEGEVREVGRMLLE